MKLIEAIEVTKRYYGFCLPKTEIAETLCLSVQAINKRIRNNGELKYDEAFMLAKKYKLPVKLYFEAQNLPKTIEVDYLEIPNFDLIKNPLFQKYYMDFQIAYNYKRAFNKDDFKIACVPNNKLSNPNGLLWLRAKDIVLLDTSETDIRISGLYYYTCNNNYVNCAYIQMLENNEVAFKFTNPETTQIRTMDWLKSAGFKVRGRIIKNIFYFA